MKVLIIAEAEDMPQSMKTALRNMKRKLDKPNFKVQGILLEAHEEW